MIEELLQPLKSRYYDARHVEKIKGMSGTDPDVEAWAFDPLAFEALLKRLEPYRRVVLLSGDVHFAFSASLSYWKKADEEPARFAQFTSSGLMNAWPAEFRAVHRSFALAPRIFRARDSATRLGWDHGFPTPISLPPGATVVPAVRARLRVSPVLIPAEGWPDGTIADPPPDWAWRLRLERDERPDSQRPEVVRPEPLPEDAGSPATIDDYRSIALRYVKTIDKMTHARQLVFANNMGVVRFELPFELPDGKLAARHELYTVHPEAMPPDKPFVATVHVVPLEKPSESKPAIGGES